MSPLNYILPASFRREIILASPCRNRILSSSVSNISAGTSVGFPYLSRATWLQTLYLCELSYCRLDLQLPQ